jgi:hypothetical protein
MFPFCTCFLAIALRLFGVMMVPPQFTTVWAVVKYFAYVKSRKEVEVTYCMLLSLILNKSPPEKYWTTPKHDSYIRLGEVEN